MAEVFCMTFQYPASGDKPDCFCPRWRCFGTQLFTTFDDATSYVPYSRILESAHSGFTMAFNITYVIDGFGDLVAISDLAWCV